MSHFLLSMRSRWTLVGTRVTGNHSSVSVCLNCQPSMSSVATKAFVMVELAGFLDDVSGMGSKYEFQSIFEDI
jgi:hypothetical protein